MRRTFLLAALVSTMIVAFSVSSQAQVSTPGPTGGNTAIVARTEAPALTPLTPPAVRPLYRPMVVAPVVAPTLGRLDLMLFARFPVLAVLWRRGLL